MMRLGVYSFSLTILSYYCSGVASAGTDLRVKIVVLLVGLFK